jgi:hypothetical protein
VDGNTLPALVDPCGSRPRRVDVAHARQYAERNSGGWPTSTCR